MLSQSGRERASGLRKKWQPRREGPAALWKALERLGLQVGQEPHSPTPLLSEALYSARSPEGTRKGPPWGAPACEEIQLVATCDTHPKGGTQSRGVREDQGSSGDALRAPGEQFWGSRLAGRHTCRAVDRGCQPEAG